MKELDMHTTHYPSNPLPFQIVNESCGDCIKYMYDLNDYVEQSCPGEEVHLILKMDTAGRGWHIKNYVILDEEGEQ